MLILYITLKPALVTDDQRRDWTFCWLYRELQFRNLLLWLMISRTGHSVDFIDSFNLETYFCDWRLAGLDWCTSSQVAWCACHTLRRSLWCVAREVRADVTPWRTMSKKHGIKAPGGPLWYISVFCASFHSLFVVVSSIPWELLVLVAFCIKALPYHDDHPL